MTAKELMDFYARWMSCTKCPNKNHPSIKRDDKGYRPRGFYFESSYFKSPRKVLTVANNPGTLGKGEADCYSNQEGLDLVKAHLEYMRTVDARSAFHRKLRQRYLTAILNLPRDKIFNDSAFTNLVKCTKTDTSMFQKSHPTVKKCFDEWFEEELRLYDPEAILAVGVPTARFLREKSEIIGIPSKCIIYVKHPSRGGYSEEREREELRRIREKLNKCV